MQPADLLVTWNILEYIIKFFLIQLEFGLKAVISDVVNNMVSRNSADKVNRISLVQRGFAPKPN